MEQIINEYFNNRYKYLLECANNILKLVRRQDLKYNLVSDAYLYLINNQDKIESKLKAGKIESVVVRWMTMQIKWSNTQFKREWIYPNNHNSDKPLEELESVFNLEEDLTDEEILQNEKEIQDKLNHIQIFMLNEPPDQQLLYKYIFQDGIDNSGKLSRFTGIPRTGCYYLIKELKERIKNNYENGII